MEEALKQMQLEKLASAHGLHSIRMERRKRQKRIVTELLVDYTKHSTLHGLQYITARSLNIIENLFWLLTFLVSAGLCAYLINNVYMKWKTSPVIITVSERLVSVSRVPFPSLTICPQMKSKASVYNASDEYYKMQKLQNKNKSIDRDTMEMFEDISWVCEYEASEFEPNYRLVTNASTVERIISVAPNLDEGDLFMFCTWHGIPCDSMFQRVLTAEGVCYNMNGLASNEIFSDRIQSDYNYINNQEPSRGWSIDDGYTDSEGDLYPRRGSENRPSPDLVVELYSFAKDNDIMCNGVNSGYKIYLSHPADMPQSPMYYYAAINGQSSSMAVSFHVLNTSESLSNYSPEDRQCYFPKDIHLRYFKIYTAKNCLAECLSNYTFRQCGCVGYYMPHDNSSNICGRKSYLCMVEAQEFMVKEELRLKETEKGGCRCLQACNSVEYDAEVLKTDYKLADVVKGATEGMIFPPLEAMEFSKFEVYFKKPEFLSMRRSELFGLTDFLANIGGLLGVFLGFSFLSLVELVYFLTIRIGFTLRRDLSEEKTNTKVKE